MTRTCATVCRDSFISLVEEYDAGKSPESKAAWLSSNLGMQLPPSADRYRPMHCQPIHL